MTSKTDIRSIRTEAAIKAAFEEMVLDKSIGTISVAGLTAHAHINRKTFYLHYDTLTDLVDSYVDDVTLDIIDRLSAHAIPDYIRDPGMFLDIFIDFFESKRTFFTYVMTNDEYSSLARQVERRITAEVSSALSTQTKLSASDARLIATFIFTVMMAALRMAISDELDYTEADFRSRIVRMAAVGLSGFGFDFKQLP